MLYCTARKMQQSWKFDNVLWGSGWQSRVWYNKKCNAHANCFNSEHYYRCPWATTRQQDHFIILMSLRDGTATASALRTQLLTASNVNNSEQMIQSASWGKPLFQATSNLTLPYTGQPHCLSHSGSVSSVVDKAAVVQGVLYLSLIHIWRCRRAT